MRPSILAWRVAMVLVLAWCVIPVRAVPLAKHPDLTGVWRVINPRLLGDLPAGGRMPPMQPAASAIFRERRASGLRGPAALCLPRGLPGEMLARETPFKIVQTSGQIVMLFAQSLHFRQIFTDGRAFPDERAPAWFGYSTGTWENDTLVVQTLGVTEQTWLDEGGHPHGPDMRLTERFRRISASRLDVQLTIDDPQSYTRPWTVRLAFESQPESALVERVCAAHPAQ